MSPVDKGPANESASRRERGVIAQRAYRKRHASKFQKLKEENDRLRDAIQHIGVVAAGEGRFTTDLDSVISLAKDVAVAGDEGSDAAESAVKSAGKIADIEAPDRTGSSTPQNGSKTWSNTPGWRNIPTSSGIFVDASLGMRSFSMPANCVSYLGHTDPSNLAGGMYRAVLSIAIRRWHEHFQTHGSTDSSNSSMASFNNIAPSQAPLNLAFPLIAPYQSDNFAPQCVFSYPPSQITPDSTPICAHDVVKRCRINEPEGWWRAADGVEAYLRNQVLPAEALAIFEEVMRGGGTEKQIEDVKSVLEGMASNYKCFGDGPRWNAVYVTVAMDMFRKDLMGEEYENHP